MLLIGNSATVLKTKGTLGKKAMIDLRRKRHYLKKKKQREIERWRGRNRESLKREWMWYGRRLRGNLVMAVDYPLQWLSWCRLFFVFLFYGFFITWCDKWKIDIINLNNNKISNKWNCEVDIIYGSCSWIYKSASERGERRIILTVEPYGLEVDTH